VSAIEVNLDHLAERLYVMRGDFLGTNYVAFGELTENARESWKVVARTALASVIAEVTCYDCGARATENAPQGRPAPAGAFCSDCYAKRWLDPEPAPGPHWWSGADAVTAPTPAPAPPTWPQPGPPVPPEFVALVGTDGECYHIRRCEIVCVGRYAGPPDGRPCTVVALRDTKVNLTTSDASHTAFLEQVGIL